MQVSISVKTIPNVYLVVYTSHSYTEEKKSSCSGKLKRNHTTINDECLCDVMAKKLNFSAKFHNIILVKILSF